MRMTPSRRFGALLTPALALILGAGLAGCVTHRVQPTLSKAVVEARKHKDVEATTACPDLAAPISVGFAFGESGLSELATPALEQVTKELACHPGEPALIAGQADNHGTDAEQRQLAQARVTAVMDYLRAHNVAPARLQTQVMGTPPGLDPQRIVVLAEGRRW